MQATPDGKLVDFFLQAPHYYSKLVLKKPNKCITS